MSVEEWEELTVGSLAAIALQEKKHFCEKYLMEKGNEHGK